MEVEPNGQGRQCPQCEYVRSVRDQNPTWQCPSCLCAYDKVGASQNPRAKTAPAAEHHHVLENPMLRRCGKIIDIVLLLALIVLAISYWQRGVLPDLLDIHSSSYKAPSQIAIEQPNFSFDYREQRIKVRPHAKYELCGLVVSHNDIDGFIDGYNEDDVNIKDICVIWGNNLYQADYQNMKFWSRQWTCWMEGKSGQYFDHTALSNSHLISDDPYVRQQIRELRVGDQIHLQGRLVDYSTPEFGGWRKTSLTRNDSGNGACEVVFVEYLQVLRHGTPFWYALFEYCKYLVLILIALRVVLFFADMILYKKRA